MGAAAHVLARFPGKTHNPGAARWGGTPISGVNHHRGKESQPRAQTVSREDAYPNEASDASDD